MAKKHPRDIHEDWSFKSGLSAYVILKESSTLPARRIANITFKATESRVKVIAWKFEEPDYGAISQFFQGHADGYGFDKYTAALSGFKLDGYTVVEQGERWQRQLEDHGLTVIRAL